MTEEAAASANIIAKRHLLLTCRTHIGAFSLLFRDAFACSVPCVDLDATRCTRDQPVAVIKQNSTQYFLASNLLCVAVYTRYKSKVAESRECLTPPGVEPQARTRTQNSHKEPGLWIPVVTRFLASCELSPRLLATTTSPS